MIEEGKNESNEEVNRRASGSVKIGDSLKVTVREVEKEGGN